MKRVLIGLAIAAFASSSAYAAGGMHMGKDCCKHCCHHHSSHMKK